MTIESRECNPNVEATTHPRSSDRHFCVLAGRPSGSLHTWRGQEGSLSRDFCPAGAPQSSPRHHLGHASAACSRAGSLTVECRRKRNFAPRRIQCPSRRLRVGTVVACDCNARISGRQGGWTVSATATVDKGTAITARTAGGRLGALAGLAFAFLFFIGTAMLDLPHGVSDRRWSPGGPTAGTS